MNYRLCILASGGLGFLCLEWLINNNYKISKVFTDKSSISILRICKKNGISTYIGNPRKERASNEVKKLEVDVIISLNYLYLIPETLIKSAKICAVNFHGSLLPKYRGRTPHVWAIINGEKYSGVTVHLIEKEVDSGPIICQEKVEIYTYDTGASILKKFSVLYPKLLKNLLEKLVLKPIEGFKVQNHENATYFGKRTPQDGLINWSWHANRIINWIRAQSPPYPGAFSFLEGYKITFISAVKSNIGFDSDMPDGTILKNLPLVNKLFVKCPNHVLELKYIDFDESKEILKEKLLLR